MSYTPPKFVGNTISKRPPPKFKSPEKKKGKTYSPKGKKNSPLKERGKYYPQQKYNCSPS